MSESPTATPQPRLIDVVQSELRDVMILSTKYQEAIKGSKSQVKKDYYQKKLKKNNKRLMQMLVAYNKLKEKHGDTSTPVQESAEPSED